VMFDGMILAQFNPLRAVVAVPLFTFTVAGHTVVVSNHAFTIAMAAILLLILLPLAMRKRTLVPSGVRNAVEAICLYIRKEVAMPLLHDKTDRYIGYLWTIFFFILTMNLLSIVPTDSIVTLLTGTQSRFGGPVTANIWVTGTMAVLSFALTHACGIRQQGVKHYFINLAPKVPWPLVPLIYFMELVTLFIRPFTLAIRLFANMIAGHVILATILGLIFVFRSYAVATVSVLATVGLSLLELLVAFLQAFIFMFLTTVYISFAVEPEH
jgi:F-type H+-transporting ATPase subunit a